MMIGDRISVCPERIRYVKWDFDNDYTAYKILLVLDTDEIITWGETKRETVDKILNQVADAITYSEELRKASGSFGIGNIGE